MRLRRHGNHTLDCGVTALHRFPFATSVVSTASAVETGAPASLDVILPDGPVERLAQRLHWYMERLLPMWEPEWEQLSASQKDFFRYALAELFEHERELIVQALAFADHHAISWGAQISE